MSVRHRRQDPACELFAKEHGALGLAAGAEAASGAATECHQVLALTDRTTEAGEASLQPPAVKKRLDRPHNHRARRPGAGFKANLVSPDVAVEMALKQLINRSFFGMPGPIRNRRITKQKGGLRREGIVGPSSKFFQQTACSRAPCHVRRQTSCGRKTAMDLTASEKLVPRFCAQPRGS